MTVRVRAHEMSPKVGDALAAVGTAGWARTVRDLLREAIAYEANYADRAWSYLEELESAKGWSLLTDARGEPFVSFRAFVEHARPEGLGVSLSRVEFIQQEHRKVLANGGVRPGAGRKMKGQAENNQSGNYKADSSDGSIKYGTAEHWRARLTRDAEAGDGRMEAILHRLDSGEISANRAAIDAGYRKPPDVVKVANRAIRKVPDDRRHEILSTSVRDLQQVVRRLSADEQGQLYEWLGKELGLR